MSSSFYQQRPPIPRYSVVFEWAPFEGYLTTLVPLTSLDQALLTRKTLTLLKMVTLARGIELADLTMGGIEFRQGRLILRCLMTKGTGVMSNFQKSTIHPVVVDPCRVAALCPVSHLWRYLTLTKSQRRAPPAPGGNRLLIDKRPVFLYVNGSGRPLTAQRIAKMVKMVMTDGGVDTTVYKSHSLRAVCATRAIEAGAALDDVLKQGGWSSDFVFRKFYDLAPPKVAFTDSVLLGDRIGLPDQVAALGLVDEDRQVELLGL